MYLKISKGENFEIDFISSSITDRNPLEEEN